MLEQYINIEIEWRVTTSKFTLNGPKEQTQNSTLH